MDFGSVWIEVDWAGVAVTAVLLVAAAVYLLFRRRRDSDEDVARWLNRQR